MALYIYSPLPRHLNLGLLTNISIIDDHGEDKMSVLIVLHLKASYNIAEPEVLATYTMTARGSKRIALFLSF